MILILLFPMILLGQDKYEEDGRASYYSDKFEGKSTASGDKYHKDKMTAAHRHLPFGTVVRVTNKENQKTVDVVINDRGPYVEGRIIDLSRAAAETLGIIQAGVARVHLEVIEPYDPKSEKYSEARPLRKETDVDESVYYRIDLQNFEPKSGFGVQIGSYEESANLLTVVDHLQKAYQKELIVETSKIQGKRFYKIILGDFRNREQAEKLKSELDSTYPGCFIVDLSK